MTTTFKLRRGTAAAWTGANPTLAAGEPGYETDTGKIKYGDGSTAWNSLAYFSSGGGAPTGSAGGALDGTYPNPGLAASVAGAGLAETSDVLSVNVDGSTIEINSDALRVKAGGITANEIGDAELAALAGLTSAANKLPYFTGSGAAALETRIPWTMIQKPGDESVSGSTTVQDDDDLQFTAASGGIYELWITLIYASPLSGATPDLKVDFGEDGTDRGALIGIGRNTSDTVVAAANRIAQGVSSSWGTAAIDRAAVFFGNYYGAGGTFKVRWAQATSDGNPTTMRAGSVLRYRKLN